MTFCKKLYIKYIMWLHILICGFLRCKKGCEFKMSLICVDNLSKTFRVSRRSSGLKAALRSFVKRDYTYVNAVDNISFNINEGEIHTTLKVGNLQFTPRPNGNFSLTIV